MLQLHESGLVRWRTVEGRATARMVAEDACRALAVFTCSSLELRTVEVLAVDSRYLATVEIVERWGSNSIVLSARCEGETQQHAVALTTLRAIAPDADVLAAGLVRLFERGVVPAALVEGDGRARFAIGDPSGIATLETLSDGWQSNGLLSVGFGGASHRVIRTPALRLVMTVSERPALAAEADRWLDHVWHELRPHL